MSAELDAFIIDVKAAPPLRKLSAAVERTDLPADIKAMLMDIAALTIKVAGKVIAIGRKILAFALDLIRVFPAMAMGAVVALVLSSLIDAIPVLGNKAVMAILAPLLLAIGVGIGALQDMASPGFGERVAALVDSFRALLTV